MRRKLYEIISNSNDNSKWCFWFNIFMIIVIVLSFIPLAIKEQNPFINILDKICAVIFIIDYIIRWITADYKYKNHNIISFLRYPFSIMAIIDLISILPSLSLINQSFKLLRLMRMFRALRVFRTFKLFRYSKNITIIVNVFKRQKHALGYVMVLAVAYILISALIIFNVEPNTFNSFFDAVYWATVSLTTIGYGDIYPVSTIGRIITMISSLFGVAIIALPAGIITTGYMEELNDLSKNQSESKHSEKNMLDDDNTNAD
ncbi:MAG: ion transporter [Acutalibacteraceae bacterium]